MGGFKISISLEQAKSGYVAQTTASRNAAGQVVGTSAGSNYVRAQEAAANTSSPYTGNTSTAENGLGIVNSRLPSWYTNPETANIDRSQLQQFQTVDQPNVWSRAKDTLVDVWNQSNKAAVEIIGLKPEQLSNADNARKTQIGLNHNPENNIQVYSAGNRSLTGLANQGLHDFLTTQRNEIAEKPLNFGGNIAVSLGAGYVGGAVLSGGGMVLRSGLVRVGLPRIAGAVEPGINIVLGASVIKEATEIKSVEEGLTFGKDLLFMGAGYKAGQTRGVRTFDSLRTVRAKEISVESLVKEDVLSGKEQFPLTQKGANAQDVLNSYKDPISGEFTGYHATTTSLGKNPEVWGQIKRIEDVPGLYVSPLKEGTSPHFLRISDGKVSNLKYASEGLTEIRKGIKTGIHDGNINIGQINIKKIKSGSKKIEEALIGTSRPLEPNVMKISISNMDRLPSEVRTSFVKEGGKDVPKAAQNWLKSGEAPKGTAFLTPLLESTVKSGGRAEAEAVISPGTHLEQLSTEKHFFDWNGRKVELKEYKTVESESSILDKTGSNNKDLVTAEDLFSSYRYEAPGSKGLISEIAYPIRSSSYLVDPLRSSGSLVDPLRSSGSLVDPLRSTSPVVDPLRSTSFIKDPLRSTSSVVDPLRSTSSVVDPFRSSRSIFNPDRNHIPEPNRKHVPDPNRNNIPHPNGNDIPYPPEPVIPDPPEPVIPDPPIPDINKKKDDFNLDIDPLEQPQKLRKTKKKMLKNQYGDPFNIKIKL